MGCILLLPNGWSNCQSLTHGWHSGLYKINHMQSFWLWTHLWWCFYEVLTSPDEQHLTGFFFFYIPVWVFYSGSDNQPVKPCIFITNASDRESFFSYPPFWYLFWESLNIFKVNLKTFSFIPLCHLIYYTELSLYAFIQQGFSVLCDKTIVKLTVQVGLFL